MFKHSLLQIYVYEIKIKNKISINRGSTNVKSMINKCVNEWSKNVGSING